MPPGEGGFIDTAAEKEREIVRQRLQEKSVSMLYMYISLKTSRNSLVVATHDVMIEVKGSIYMTSSTFI